MSPVQTRFDKKGATVEGVVAAMKTEGYALVEGMFSKATVKATKADLLELLGYPRPGRKDQGRFATHSH